MVQGIASNIHFFGNHIIFSNLKVVVIKFSFDYSLKYVANFFLEFRVSMDLFRN